MDLQYVDVVNSNLICCICRMPFTNPTATTTCTHTFCKDCIIKALSFQEECPVDRSPLTQLQLQPASSIVRNLVDELMVKCPNATFGCNEFCQRQLLNSHLTNQCQFAATHCCENDCDQVLLKRDVDKHTRDCVHRLVRCDACDASVKFKDLDDHALECPAAEWTCPHCELTFTRSARASHLSECEHLQVSCDHSVNGCPWNGPRRDSQTHLSSCPYESIKGFFALNTSRMSSLESENGSLRRRVEELESTLADIKREVQSAKSSLGPWFRPSGSRPPPLTPPSRPERVQRRRMSAPLNTASFGFPLDQDDDEVHGGVIHIQQHTSYHDENEPSSTFHHHSISVTPPGEPPMSSYFPMLPDGTQPMSSYAQSRVAPIDLSTSLEGCLTSLRNSIVTLSASVDSLERRQDIALTTETLRMHEDVASLRAIVHGLRMQVHSIMMDRNWQVSGRSGALGDPQASHTYGPNEPTAAVESNATSSRPYRPFAGPPIVIGQTTSIRRTSGAAENKL